MLGNIWLKVKVFFIISSVLALLSLLYYNLFEKLVSGINFQQGTESTFRFLEQRVKNAQYELITQSFGIAAKLKIGTDKKTKQLIIDAQEVDRALLFAVLDGAGTVVSGNFQTLNSLVGVPAVDRAIRDGVASDGTMRIGNEEYLIGVAPVNADTGLDKPKRLIVVSMAPIRDAFGGIRTTFPAQVYSGGIMVHEFDKEQLSKIISGPEQAKIQAAIEAILAGGNSDQPVNRWLRIFSFAMPNDLRSPGKIVFVGFMSAVPGYEVYHKSVTYIAIYALLAIFITLVFTFVITYDVDRGFKKLAADISRLKVGEKLMLHKYNHGAGLVVSALNHMIGNYQKHGGDDGAGAMFSSLIPEAKEEPETEIPEPSFDRKRETMDTSKQPEPKESSRPAPAPRATVDDEVAVSATPVSANGSAPAPASQDPYAGLWETYKNIKIKNGEKIADQEKAAFLAKLKTNRVSIMTKYSCKDVSFSIEEKEGKPVIKAKPVK
jgi:hypothetical protein